MIPRERTGRQTELKMMYERLPISFSSGRDGVRGSILTRRATEHLG